MGLNLASCQLPVRMSGNGGEGKQLRMSFNDVDGWVPIDPVLPRMIIFFNAGPPLRR